MHSIPAERRIPHKLCIRPDSPISRRDDRAIRRFHCPHFEWRRAGRRHDHAIHPFPDDPRLREVYCFFIDAQRIARTPHAQCFRNVAATCNAVRCETFGDARTDRRERERRATAIRNCAGAARSSSRRVPSPGAPAPAAGHGPTIQPTFFLLQDRGHPARVDGVRRLTRGWLTPKHKESIAAGSRDFKSEAVCSIARSEF
jgi:hypothetical protein